VIQDLDIKITTARFIINKYKESGSYPRRKFRKTGNCYRRKEAELQEMQESIQSPVEDNNR
jgi:hypothetical protein